MSLLESGGAIIRIFGWFVQERHLSEAKKPVAFVVHHHQR
jgi:hypothetical protein